MNRGGTSRSKQGRTNPLDSLLEDLQQNPIPGLFSPPPGLNSVVVYDWWLVRSNMEGESKTVAVAGYIPVEERKPFISAPIVKRRDAFTLEAADGVTVVIEGMINHTNTEKNGFSPEVCKHFSIGFPLFWEQYLDSCVAPNTPPAVTNTSQILKEFVIGARNILISDLEHEGHPISSDNNVESEAVVTLEKGHTSSKKVSDTPRRSGRLQEHEGHPISSDNNVEAEAVVTLEKGYTSSKKVSDTPRRRGRLQKPEKSQEPSTEDITPQSISNSRGKEPALTNIEVPDITPTGGKRSRIKEHVPQDETSGRVNSRSANMKVPDMTLTGSKRSRKKDHVPQDKASGRGRGHSANMKARGATSSLPLPESNIRRSRSGRTIIPPVHKGSQEVVYDQNGNFAGITTPSSVSTGSASKRRGKKRF